MGNVIGESWGRGAPARVNGGPAGRPTLAALLCGMGSE